MPNLEHDPKNPTDLLDRPIAVGDVVAWGTTYGRSAALCIAVIERIRFIQNSCQANGYKITEVPQVIADDYQLVLRPIKSTGSVTDTEFIVDGWYNPATEQTEYFKPIAPKLKTVKLVKNIVKLEPFDE